MWLTRFHAGTADRGLVSSGPWGFHDGQRTCRARRPTNPQRRVRPGSRGAVGWAGYAAAVSLVGGAAGSLVGCTDDSATAAIRRRDSAHPGSKRGRGPESFTRRASEWFA